MIHLKGQTALIFGGTDSLVNGIMRQMQQAGALVMRGDESAYLAADPEVIAAYLANFERIDTLVILPTWYKIGTFMDSSPEAWDDALKANYECAVYLSQAVARHMIARQIAGSIIFVSHVAVQMPLLQTVTLGTSLAALYPLAKMAAVDCGPYGIRVNTLTLGWVESEWAVPHVDSAEKRAYIEAGIPLGHIGTPESVGDVCCFLASDLSRYITGSIIPVDGGYSLTRSEGTSPYPS